jgi:hypothetical protein
MVWSLLEVALLLCGSTVRNFDCTWILWSGGLRIVFSCKKVSIDKASRGVMLWFWILVLGPICIMEFSMERIVP